jgi:hypothetical protein
MTFNSGEIRTRTWALTYMRLTGKSQAPEVSATADPNA